MVKFINGPLLVAFMKLHYDLLQADSLVELVGLLNQLRPAFTLIGTPRQEGAQYVQLIHTLVEERISGSSAMPSLDECYAHNPHLLSTDAETAYTIIEKLGVQELYNQFGEDNHFIQEVIAKYEKSKKKRRA